MDNSPKNGFPDGFYEPEENDKSLKDYIRLIKNNLLLFILITIIVFAGAAYYAFSSVDIYSSETSVKINSQQGNILQSPIPEFQDFGNDRFVANEIELLKSYKLRLKVAETFLDSFNLAGNRELYSLIFIKDAGDDNLLKLREAGDIAKILSGSVNIEQKKGLDFISIEAESPSPDEAALIGNIYANEYKNLNLEINRDQLTFVKNFLDNQKDEKQVELRNAEDSLKLFQEKGGVIALG